MRSIAPIGGMSFMVEASNGDSLGIIGVAREVAECLLEKEDHRLTWVASSVEDQLVARGEVGIDRRATHR